MNPRQKKRMCAQFLLFLMCVAVIVPISRTAWAETLYNGIVLPDSNGFPPDVNTTEANYANATQYAINNHLPQPFPDWLSTRPSVIPINIGRQFFIPLTSGSPGPNNPDSTNREFLVDSMSNITRTYHNGTYHDTAHGLLDPNVDPCLTFSDGVWFDPSRGKYYLFTHMQYTSGSPYFYAIGRYVSDDAVNWTRDCNSCTITIQDSFLNEVNADIMGSDSDTVWLDQDEQNPAKRWKAFFCWKNVNSGVAGTSSDSNHFEPCLDLGNICNQDRTTIFMNSFRRKGVWSIRGGCAGADRMRLYVERDPNVFCTPAEGGWPGSQPYWVGSDVLDPNSIWVTFLPTLYNLDCTPYESMMLGMFSVTMLDKDNGVYENREDKINQVYLGFSYDGWYFHRPVDANGKHMELCPVVPAPGNVCDPNNRNWAGANVQSVAGSPLIVGPSDNEQLYFYASGRGLDYSTHFCLGMRYMRRDGFCSMDAGSTEGTVLTHPVTFNGKYMFVNAAMSGGSLKVEAIDPNSGSPISPFTKANCNAVAVDKTSVQVSWSGASDLSALSNTKVQFKFYITNGSLYSFWVTQSSSGASYGYVGGGGAHYTSNKDTVGLGGNMTPTAYAGVDQSITWPTNTVTLSGTVSDDGLPNPPGVTTCTWSKTSGPGTVTFGNVNSASTTATFSTTGTYVVRLTASDSSLSSYDEATITVNSGNIAPTVNAGGNQGITWPTNTVSLSGTVSDDGQPNPPGATTCTWSKTSGPGTVTFANANAASTTATFSTTGTYVLQLLASDSNLTATSSVTITVNTSVSNTPPTVSAGNNQSITWPTNSLTLAGTVSDDGLPNPPATTTCTWSRTSGPGTVTFGNVNAANTTATFSTTGTYVVQLQASDSNLSASSQAIISVNPAGSGPNPVDWLKFDEGSGSTASDSSGNGRSGTLVNSPSWITGKYSNALSFNGSSSYCQVSNFSLNASFSVAFWFKPASGSLDSSQSGYHYVFSWGSTPEATNGVNMWFTTASEPGLGVSLRTFACDSSGTYLADGDCLTVQNTSYAFYDGNWHHYALTFSGTNGRKVYIDGSLKQSDTKDVGHSITPSTNIIVGGRSDLNSSRFYNGGVDDVRIYNVELSSSDVTNVMNNSSGGGGNNPPTVSAGNNQTIVLPAAATLSGTVSDDGLPNPPAATTCTWSKTSGPGTVTFGNANLASTTATFSVSGTYVLTLTASDSNLSASSNVTITADGAPTANAGGNHTITLPTNSLTLAGTISDDGIPAACTCTWSKTSGPGTVTFGSINAASSTATFSAIGTYVVRLTVTDTVATAYNEATIISNTAPTATAGNNQTIVLPAAATLSGSISDDGIPAAATCTWSKTSGPGTVTFGNQNAASTTATFSVSGTYVLTLTANDTAATGTSSVTITADGAPTANAGVDQEITWPTNSVTLAGTISDDGIPAASTCTWSKTSGPGTVTFGNANAANTTATFSTMGTYVVRLTVTDTAASAYDEATITIDPNSSVPTKTAWLKLDEGSGSSASDSTGNGHTGTLYSSPSWITGKFSNALSFNGSSSYMQISNFSLNSNFSVSFWFKPASGSLDSGQSGYHYVFSWGNVPEATNTVSVWFTTGSEPNWGTSIRTFASDANGTSMNDSDCLTVQNTTYNFYDGNWHLYTLTFSGTNGRKVYLDGNMKVSDTKDVGHSITLPTNIFVGARSDLNSARYYNGGVDDLRIYNLELASTDVSNIYSGQ